MSELLHTLQHALGLCGEKHLSIISALMDYSNLQAILTYIKVKF